MRLEFAGRSVGFGVGARAGYQTPAFAGRTARTSRTAARGSYRAPGEARLLSGGHDGDLRERCARGPRMGLPDCCVLGKGAPLPLRPLRAQARRRQNPEDQCNPNTAPSAPRLVRNLLQPTTAGKLGPLPSADLTSDRCRSQRHYHLSASRLPGVSRAPRRRKQQLAA